MRDFAEVIGKGVIDVEIVDKALDFLEVDKCGLDLIDRRMLQAMISKFHGGPVGLDTIAAAINEDAVTIEDVIEPYLLQLGYIVRTPRGRIVLKNAYDHLGLKYPEQGSKQLSLFDGSENNDD